MTQPDPSWTVLGDETDDEFLDDFDYDHEDDGLYIPDMEEC